MKQEKTYIYIYIYYTYTRSRSHKGVPIGGEGCPSTHYKDQTPPLCETWQPLSCTPYPARCSHALLDPFPTWLHCNFTVPSKVRCDTSFMFFRHGSRSKTNNIGHLDHLRPQNRQLMCHLLLLLLADSCWGFCFTRNIWLLN